MGITGLDHFPLHWQWHALSECWLIVDSDSDRSGKLVNVEWRLNK